MARTTARKEAKDKGESRYFTGKPCRHGHIADRITASGSCVACIKEREQGYSQKSRAKNGERIKQAKKKYCDENKDKTRARCRAWYLANRAKAIQRTADWKKANPEQAKIHAREGNIRNAPTKAMHVANRRAMKASATPAWADHDAIKSVYKHVPFLDKICGVKHHVDHIIPLNGENVCGLHVEYNLQILPAAINVAKGNRLVEDMSEWLQ